MSDLYLITGFLGAGKTTFLRHFLPLFRDPSAENPRPVRLIINEFGKEGVDGTLLSDLETVVEEITGGSVFCACRMDQFESALAACGPDEIILVEASGLSDPTGVRRLFQKDGGRFPQIRYRGAVCLADARRFRKIIGTARSAVRQIAASDVVLLNKTDAAAPEETDEAERLIRDLRPDIPLFRTAFGALPPHFLDTLHAAQNGDRTPLPLVADLTTRCTTVRLRPTIRAYDLEMFVRMFAENTYRVKGLIPTADRGLVLCDCVGNVVSVTPFTRGGARPTDTEDGTLTGPSDQSPDTEDGILTVLSGGNTALPAQLREACRWYAPFIVHTETRI